MFSITFMVVVFVLTQTVSHFFPKLCAALQRKFGTDAACRAGSRYVFGLVSRERITANGIALRSARMMRRRLPNRGGRFSSASRIAPKRRQVRCGDRPRHVLKGYSDVGQRLVAAEGTVVGEFDVPGERRGSRIRIERRRHLRSVRVSVDAVLERDWRQLDVREQQVWPAVAEDDHCQVSRRRDLCLRHRIDVQNPRATNRVRRRIEDLTVTGDELAVRKHASVVLRGLERGRARRRTR
jgi:hypothetical protein